MFMRASCICLAAGTIVLLIAAGCSKCCDQRDFSAISFQRRTFEKNKTLDFVSGPKVIGFRADIEYPSEYGLSESDYEGLMGFVNHMLNSGTNFESAVEQMADALFAVVQPLTTNENLKADADLGISIEGNIHYSDDRYMSCEMSMQGLVSDNARAVYDRWQMKTLSATDFVSSNNFPRLQQLLRDHIKVIWPGEMGDGIFKECPKEWPVIDENFYVDDLGIDWLFKSEQMGGWTSLHVSWDDLRPIMVDPSMVPSGRNRYVGDDKLVDQGDGHEWWNISYSRVDLYETTPPNPPWAGTNYPYATFDIGIRKPVQGRMSVEKYSALQNFIGSAITHGKTPHKTIDEAIDTERKTFWDGVIAEMKKTKKSPSDESLFDQFEMNGEIKYSTQKYFCYNVRHQYGCSCCSGETNVVWSWNAMAEVKIDDIVDTHKYAKELKRLMRKAVIEGYGDDYADNMEVLLPDYAKDWPHTFSNFYLTDRGVTWGYDAGEVLIGGKGTAETTLTWEQLIPFLTDRSVIPDK